VLIQYQKSGIVFFMQDFRFTNEHRLGASGEIVGFLEKPRLWIPNTSDYPDHFDWLAKVGTQLEGEQKRAMVAYYAGDIVGAVVYQRHLSEPTTLEIKNISVSPTAQGRYVGSFLLRNTEIEGTQHDFPGCNRIVFDTKTTNTGIVAFGMRHGYRLAGIEDLYRLGAGEDAIFAKSVTPATAK
jgi:ribosomal protein S18 acetylase RimI-like enzyme